MPDLSTLDDHPVPEHPALRRRVLNPHLLTTTDVIAQSPFGDAVTRRILAHDPRVPAPITLGTEPGDSRQRGGRSEDVRPAQAIDRYWAEVARDGFPDAVVAKVWPASPRAKAFAERKRTAQAT